MLTTIEKILFLVFTLASLTLTYITFSRMARVIFRGQGQLYLDRPVQRAWAGLVALVTQGGIIHHRRWTSIFHYGVAWSFILYFLVNLADLLEGYLPDFVFLGQTVLGDLFRLFADLFTVAGLIAVVYFIIRRFLVGSPALKVRDNVRMMAEARRGIPRDSAIVATFIFLHLGFRFLGQTFHLAHAGSDAWQPFASLVANVWASITPEALEVGRHVSWWGALGLIIGFLPYFPYTKHAHLFMGPINFATRPRRNALGAMEPLDFEDESVEQFGVARLTDLSKTQILDAFACIMCNRCQDACPAYTTGKELSPSALEVNKRYHLRQHLPGLAAGGDDEHLLMDYAISESAVWACTTCGACVQVCPVGNEPMFDILHIRRNQVLMESQFPAELKGAFNGMERMANPWGLTDDRMAWAAPLDFSVPTVEENPDFDVLYWVGCAGAFDPNAQAIARAMATLLQEGGVNYAVLGNSETCTGDSARRAGNEYLFYELAMMNIENLREIGAASRRIVTTCPHCFHTLGKEYGDLGGHFQVLHHTQFIADLIGKGRLTLQNGQLEKTTFHDPCYLGRHNQIYEEPRQALAQAGMVLLEMDRSRQDSFCCGAGGAQMWKEEEHGQAAVNTTRYEEARRTGAKTLAVGCPFCARMLSDANAEAGEAMEVQDVAQLVAAALK